MKNINEYKDAAIEFTRPYKERTAEFFSDTKDVIEDRYQREKKKYLRKRRVNKMKKKFVETLEAVTLIASIAALVISVFKLVLTIMDYKSSKPKIQPIKKTNHENSRDKKPKEKKTCGNGYITL